MELTTKEIQTVGEGRYIRRYFKRCIAAAVVAMVVVVVIGTTGVSNGWLLLPAAVFMLPYIWFYHRVTAEGIEFEKKYRTERE